MGDRGTASTKEPPVRSDESRPFVDPPWKLPFDVEQELSTVVTDAVAPGMYLVALVDAAKAQNVVLPSARDRYVNYRFYPVMELAHLLLETAQRLFPERTFRHALRTLGRRSPAVFLSSTLGKVTLGSTEGIHAAIEAMANGYRLNLRPSGVSVHDRGHDWAVVRLDKVGHFLDSHHVGAFEGLLKFAGVKGSVRIASRGPASADFLLTWNAPP